MFNYHAYELQFPDTHPYDVAKSRWATFLGEFVRPISEEFPNLLYWATDYGAHVEFKVFTDDFTAIQSKLDNFQDAGFSVNKLNRTLEEDLGCQRFIGPNSTSNRTQRATLILQSLNPDYALGFSMIQ